MTSFDAALTTLGLTRGAGAQEVRQAWLDLARRVHPDAGGDEATMQRVNAAYDVCRRALAQTLPADDSPDVVDFDDAEVTGRDMPSFVVEALPVVTFEALLVAASWLGEVLVDEPPYLLEVHLIDPAPCWCRLELVPDAGSTTVSLTVAAVEHGVAPSTIAVRDRWIAVLNELPLPE